MTKQINGDKLFVIDSHPAIPPADQLKKWEDQWFDEEEHPDVLLIQAFQAGADQELEACCEEFSRFWDETELVTLDDVLKRLRAARRPKPPSLKEQALELVDKIENTAFPWTMSELQKLRSALEQLDD
jgi:hypothetical protein